MTAEHRLLLELSDLKAITLACLHDGCGARMTVPPDSSSAHQLTQCPSCGGRWLANDRLEENGRVTVAARLLASIASLRDRPIPGVRIFLEFDEPAR